MTSEALLSEHWSRGLPPSFCHSGDYTKEWRSSDQGQKEHNYHITTLVFLSWTHTIANSVFSVQWSTKYSICFSDQVSSVSVKTLIQSLFWNSALTIKRKSSPQSSKSLFSWLHWVEAVMKSHLYGMMMATRWRAVQFFGNHLPFTTSGCADSISAMDGAAKVTRSGPTTEKHNFKCLILVFPAG